MAELEQFGVPIPEDFRALYYNYNGMNPGISFTRWERSIFLDFEWPTIQFIITGNKVMRIESDLVNDRLNVFSATLGRSLQLDPVSEKDGKVPLLMTLGTLSRNNYIAFDSTLDMLRSVCAAQDAGIIHYEEKLNREQDREQNEIYYDVKELWDVIKPFNKHAGYWTTLIEGKIEWDEIEVELPKDGIIRLDPEVRKLVIGDPQDYYDQAEKEMREAGMSEEEIRKARTVQKDE